MDTVVDFERGGTQLVDHFHEVCQNKFLSQEAKVKDVKKDLADLYHKTQQDMEAKLQKIQGGMVQLKANHEKTQNGLAALAESALIACNLT